MLRFESVLAQKRIKLKQLGPFIDINHKPNIYLEGLPFCCISCLEGKTWPGLIEKENRCILDESYKI